MPTHSRILVLFGASIADLGPVKFQVNRLFRVRRGRIFLRLRRANKEGRSAPAASGDPIREAHPRRVWEAVPTPIAERQPLRPRRAREAR